MYTSISSSSTIDTENSTHAKIPACMFEKQKQFAKRSMCRVLNWCNKRTESGEKSYNINLKDYGMAEEILCILNYEARSTMAYRYVLPIHPDFCLLHYVDVVRGKKQEIFTCTDDTYYTLHSIDEHGDMKTLKTWNGDIKIKTRKKTLKNEKNYENESGRYL